MNEEGGIPDTRRWWALALLGATFFMVILDGTIVYVALPSIEEALGFSPTGLQWVMSAYLLSFGGLLLLGGRAADLLGRRRLFMAGVTLFGASSLLCGLAWSAPVLVGARAIQGVSAAVMAPTALSLLMTVFREGPERNKALGIWGGIGGIGATAGLVIGGPVTVAFGWEGVFYINIPVALAVLALSPRLLPESTDTGGGMRCLDVSGAATVTAALVLLTCAIARAPAAGWTSAQTLSLLGCALILLVLFGSIEVHSRAPLVPFGIFRSRSLVGGNLVLLIAGISVDGTLLIVTIYAQDVLGYSTLQFGLMTAALTVMSVIGAYSGQAVVTRVGFRRVGAIGMALVGCGCLLLTRVSAGGSYGNDILFGLLLFGAGLGAAFVASQIAALAGVPERESGLAAGLVDSSFNIGGALGVAILTSVAVSAADGGHRLGGEARMAAMTAGFQRAFLVAVGIAALGALLALFLFRPAAERRHDEVTAGLSPATDTGTNAPKEGRRADRFSGRRR
jgi:EmrB/QacA subfamily drug resistance transporter